MANPYYTPSGNPGFGAPGQSAPIRSEYTAIQTAFDKLPLLAGHANEFVVINGAGTALTTIAGLSFTMNAFTVVLVANGNATLQLPAVSGTLALLASPAFTGNPTAPTPSPGDADTTIPTTAFVAAAIAAVASPNVQFLTSGTGATYTTPAGAKWIKVRLVGGGGGGSGSGAGAGNGSNGGNTTFSTLTGGGGSGSLANTNSTAAGSTATGGDVNLASGAVAGGASPSGLGGLGASSPFGGGGSSGGTGPSAGQPAGTNTGSGGGGAGSNGTVNAGAGGGSGGYVEKTISAPAATYTYTIGAGGPGGGAGGGSAAGGAGAAGLIIVEAYF